MSEYADGLPLTGGPSSRISSNLCNAQIRFSSCACGGHTNRLGDEIGEGHGYVRKVAACRPGSSGCPDVGYPSFTTHPIDSASHNPSLTSTAAAATGTASFNTLFRPARTLPALPAPPPSPFPFSLFHLLPPPRLATPSPSSTPPPPNHPPIRTSSFRFVSLRFPRRSHARLRRPPVSIAQTPEPRPGERRRGRSGRIRHIGRWVCRRGGACFGCREAKVNLEVVGLMTGVGV
jgi:hypothetical protein